MRARNAHIGAVTLLGAIAIACLSGCVAPQTDPQRIEERAVDCLTRGARYKALPTVRAQAIEALEVHGGEASLPWIRNALHDESPGVRFAACLALGKRGDVVVRPAVQRLLDSDLPSDRIGAIYALHCMGDTRHTHELADYLLNADGIPARANAALVLGRMGGEGTVNLLTRALRDSNPALRANVLEAMALQGSKFARDTLHANAYGGIGAEEAFALNTLANLRDPAYRDVFLLRLETSLHPESRLAAARGLGLLGDPIGFDYALDQLNYRATRDADGDPAANRTFRVRQLAALALGAMGDRRALPALTRMMNDANDPRLQVAAAKALLDILHSSQASPAGVATTRR